MLDLDEDPKIESPERSTPRGPTPAPVLMAEWLLDRGGGGRPSTFLPLLRLSPALRSVHFTGTLRGWNDISRSCH